MTRKDYVLLAQAFARAIENKMLNESERIGAKVAAKAVADALHQDNPRFDHDRFMAACKADR